MAGIADPMRQLPTLYSLLDAVEIMIVESQENEQQREMYFTRTYAPPAGTPMTNAALPKGWTAEDEMAEFDSQMDEENML